MRGTNRNECTREHSILKIVCFTRLEKAIRGSQSKKLNRTRDSSGRVVVGLSILMRSVLKSEE